MEPVEITAGRLHLRPWQPGDEPAVLDAGTDPETQRWTSVPSPYEEHHARDWVAVAAAKGWADGDDLTWAVCDSTTGEVLASAAVRRGCDPGVWDVGYWCRPAARGRGVTTEALQVVSRWAFAVLGARRLEWMAGVGNWPSRRVAEKAGFRVEGVLRGGMVQRGEHLDGWIAGLLPDDPQTDTGQRWQDLEGDGLRLRRWRPDDVEPVLEGLSDPGSARFLPVPSPYGRDDAEAFLAGAPHRWASGHSYPLAVEVDGRAAGLVVLLPSALDPGTAEVGWWLVPAARGRGLTVRALEALLPWAAGRGVVRATALVHPDNAASLRVAERAGFEREGVLRAALRPDGSGVRHDAVLLARVLG